jgi:transcriptional regulator with XRE-family HTH domain
LRVHGRIPESVSWSSELPELRIRVMAMDLKRRIAARVRVARRNRGVTQEQLAEAVERTVETISNIERGRTLPSLDTLKKVAKRLNIPMRDFFDDARRGTLARRRYELKSRLVEIVRSLNDADAKIAVGQLEPRRVGGEFEHKAAIPRN